VHAARVWSRVGRFHSYEKGGPPVPRSSHPILVELEMPPQGHLHGARLGQVEAVQLHDLVPSCDEVVHEARLRVVLSIHLGNRPEL